MPRIKTHPIFFCLIFLSCALNSWAQMSIEEDILDMGTIDKRLTTYEIILVNGSSQIINLIQQENGEIKTTLASNINLEPGKSIVLNIPVSKPTYKNINESISLLLNRQKEPIYFRIKGKVVLNEQKANNDCPDFSSTKVKRVKNRTSSNTNLKKNVLALKVVDQLTKNRETLNPEKYKTNNLIFLIDASISMQERNKKELLEAALLGLIKILRPYDQITMITYSGKVKTIYKTQTNVNFQELVAVINNLENQGITNGSLGIKHAYLKADSSYIQFANNEIILATDGAFNVNETDNITEDIIMKYGHSGIKLSILGINNQSWAVRDMKKLCDAGNGSYMNIKTNANASTALKKTVKNHAQK